MKINDEFERIVLRSGLVLNCVRVKDVGNNHTLFIDYEGHVESVHNNAIVSTTKLRRIMISKSEGQLIFHSDNLDVPLNNFELSRRLNFHTPHVLKIGEVRVYLTDNQMVSFLSEWIRWNVEDELRFSTDSVQFGMEVRCNKQVG